MFRKIASLSVALIVAGGVMIAVPADAATKISNGVACKKSGQTTKTSGGTYRCARNPLTSSTRLTWLSVDCLNAANDAVKARASATKTIADLRAQIPVIDLGIETEKANRAELQTKLDNANARLPLARTELEAARAKLATSATPANTKAVTDLVKAVSDWTAASRAFASLIRNKDVTIQNLERAKVTATNRPAELTSSVEDARQSARLICTRGY
jgi:hypothetical protein